MSSLATTSIAPNAGRLMTQAGFGLDRPLTGLRNYLRKDLLEWAKTRRALWTAVAAQSLLLLGVVAMRIAHTVQPDAPGIDLTANFNMYNAGWETVLPLCAAFATMGFLCGERDSRTLSWSLSMPLSRGAVLVSKLVTAIAVLAVVTFVLPLITTLVAIRLAYGELPDAYSIWAPVLTGLAIGLFMLVLNLATNAYFRSRGTVIGIAIFVAMVIPGLVENLWSAAGPWWPISIEDWIKGLANREAVNWITPVVYAVATAALLIATHVRFTREEL
jgi:ABC-type transport system involved in multi-copper enzyme maturation permease subunit